MLFLIFGDFGVGKDTFADFLLELLDAVKIKSYTTREPRYKGEDTHLFVTKQDFFDDYDANNIVAWTMIHNNYYWTTKDQFGKHKNEIYIVDDVGLRDVIKSQLFGDDYFVIEIIRPKELINVDNERLNRKRMKKVDVQEYVDISVYNDGSLAKFLMMAEGIASLFE